MKIMVGTGSYLRFHWLDDNDERTFFEFKVSINELTAEVMLIITDFAEPDEHDEIIDLWNSQVEKLRRITGII